MGDLQFQVRSSTGGKEEGITCLFYEISCAYDDGGGGILRLTEITVIASLSWVWFFQVPRNHKLKLPCAFLP